MKKIVIIVTFIICSFFSYGQTIIGTGLIIDSIVVSPIQCNGSQTSAIVYTNAASNVSYDLFLENGGTWMHHPSYPVISGGSLTLNLLSALSFFRIFLPFL